MNKLTVDQELLSILKLALDFNSEIMSIVGLELAGDWSSHNRTHQRKVIDEIKRHNSIYNERLAESYVRVNELFAGGKDTKLVRTEAELNELIIDMVSKGMTKEAAAAHITEFYTLAEGDV